MFTILPMNFLGDKKKANYLTTGLFSQIAKNEAALLCEPHECFAGRGGDMRGPEEEEFTVDLEGAYFHFCMNETGSGVMVRDLPWDKIPSDMPVFCDMSSSLCSEPVEWERLDLVYGGA